jgi:integrase
MAGKIVTVTDRAKLKPRRQPYWHRDSKGCYVGYRKMTATSAGTWWARSRDPETGKQTEHGLGDFEQFPDHTRFDRATAAAREWFAHVGQGGSVVSSSVMDACTDYVKHLREERREKTADDLDGRYRRWVKPYTIAGIELSKLKREQVKAYRKKLLSTPVAVNKDGKKRPRALDTVNRDMSGLRAALNYAKAQGKATTDLAWAEELKPIKDAGRRRGLYLDRAQRRALIDKAPADLALFLRGMCVLPLRPGALAALTVADFDKRLGVLKVGTDKHGQDRKIRMPKATATMLTECSKDKLPAAPLFARADGKAWDKDGWKWPFKTAVEAAELPAETVAYTLRHSVITDLVGDGLPTLTVAQISGTSVAMIEKHYGHLRSDSAADALARLAL